jgi:hypothetical protein
LILARASSFHDRGDFVVAAFTAHRPPATARFAGFAPRIAGFVVDLGCDYNHK